MPENERNWTDATRLITPGMPVWPGDAPVEETPAARISEGASANVSRWCFGSHTGTHIDPPQHFEPDGKAVDELDLRALCGPCRVLDVSDVAGHIDAATLVARGAEGAERILLHTRNTDADPGEFHEDYAAITPDAAAWLVAHGVRLIGVDGPSVEAFTTTDYAVHHTLLRAEVVVVEGLALRGILPGDYEMVCAPIPWQGGDGAPARVLLRRLPG